MLGYNDIFEGDNPIKCGNFNSKTTPIFPMGAEPSIQNGDDLGMGLLYNIALGLEHTRITTNQVMPGFVKGFDLQTNLFSYYNISHDGSSRMVYMLTLGVY